MDESKAELMGAMRQCIETLTFLLVELKKGLEALQEIIDDEAENSA